MRLRWPRPRAANRRAQLLVVLGPAVGGRWSFASAGCTPLSLCAMPRLRLGLGAGGLSCRSLFSARQRHLRR